LAQAVALDVFGLGQGVTADDLEVHCGGPGCLDRNLPDLSGLLRLGCLIE
jgi:hypothetical protein